MRFSLRIVGWLAGCCCLALVGCANFGENLISRASSGIDSLQGKVVEPFPVGLADAVAATESALRDLGLPIDKRRVAAMHGELDSRLADGSWIQIDFDQEARPFPNDPTRTRISIRIGAMGDEPSSKRIFDRIDYRLNNPAPPPPPPSPPIPIGAVQTEEPPRIDGQ